MRLRAPPIPEQDIHEATASLLHRIIPYGAPVEWTCIPIGHLKLSPAQMARLTRAGIKTGWPDLILVHGGGCYGIELKRRGGLLSRDRTVHNKRGSPRLIIGQTTRFPALRRAGMREIAICHNLDEVVAALIRWGVPIIGRLAA